MSSDILDDLNRAIIAALQENPSRTNKDIGETLGVSEPTVANRIRALEDANILRVMMQRDMRALGYSVFALVDLNVEGRTPENVAEDLAKLDACTSVSVAMSSPDIFANINPPDGAALQRIVDEQIAKIEGIAGGTGVALMEIYDASVGAGNGQLTAISARATVGRRSTGSSCRSRTSDCVKGSSGSSRRCADQSNQLTALSWQ